MEKAATPPVGETPNAADTSEDLPENAGTDTSTDPNGESTVPGQTGDDGDDEVTEDESKDESKDSNGVPDELTGPGLHPESGSESDLAPPHESWNPHPDTTGNTREVGISEEQQLRLPPAPIIEAPQVAVDAARNARPVFVDAANPPPPPPTAPKVDFTTQVNTVIQNNTNVTVVNNTVVPDRLTTLEYNDRHQPTFYNPYRGLHDQVLLRGPLPHGVRAGGWPGGAHRAGSRRLPVHGGLA